MLFSELLNTDNDSRNRKKRKPKQCDGGEGVQPARVHNIAEAYMGHDRNHQEEPGKANTQNFVLFNVAHKTNTNLFRLRSQVKEKGQNEKVA